MKKIYLDNYRTTKLDNDIFDLMKPYLTEDFYLPASFTSCGTHIAEIIEESKNRILNSLKIKNKKLIFTNSGTMANNIAIHGTLRDVELSSTHIITSKISHPSILNVYEFYRKRGAKTTFLNVDDKGHIDLDELKHSLTPQTKLLSITYVNHTIGTIQDIANISTIVKNYNDKIKILVDITLAINSITLQLNSINADFFSLSGHKIYGPKGSGALIVKENSGFKPILFGAVETSPFFPGGDNIAAIVGISHAVKKAVENSTHYSNKLNNLQKHLMYRIENEIDDVLLNGPKDSRVVDNINYSFRFIEGESIMMFLDFENIIIATGSACASSDLKVNYILSAIGRNHELAHGSLRITPGKETTKEEIDIFVDKLKPIIKRLRDQSSIRR